MGARARWLEPEGRIFGGVDPCCNRVISTRAADDLRRSRCHHENPPCAATTFEPRHQKTTHPAARLPSSSSRWLEFRWKSWNTKVSNLSRAPTTWTHTTMFKPRDNHFSSCRPLVNYMVFDLCPSTWQFDNLASPLIIWHSTIVLTLFIVRVFHFVVLFWTHVSILYLRLTFEIPRTYKYMSMVALTLDWQVCHCWKWGVESRAWAQKVARRSNNE